jgi:hypothetical protein
MRDEMAEVVGVDLSVSVDVAALRGCQGRAAARGGISDPVVELDVWLITHAEFRRAMARARVRFQQALSCDFAAAIRRFAHLAQLPCTDPAEGCGKTLKM